MSKQYKIRWREADEQELVKAVRNFNAKLKRIEKKNPEMKNALPDRITVRQMKELVNTRQDLKREINALRRFSKRGAETLVDVPNSYYNLQITKWQKTEMSRRIGIINRKRKKKQEDIADLDMTSRGQALGYKRGTFGMGTLDENKLKPMNAFTPKMTRNDLKKKFEAILVESQSTYWSTRDVILKDNYISTLAANFNTNEISDVIKAIYDMDMKEFRKIFEAEGGTFDFAYPLNEAQKKAYLTALKSTWLPIKR